MKKRQVAIIPLIFASMIMLLSSVMPHHHHGKLICFTNSHEVSSLFEEHQHESHDSQSEGSECEVKLLFQTNIIKQHYDECNCCPEINSDQWCYFLLPLAGSDHSLLLLGKPKKVSPTFYKERLHSMLWSVTSAGRAPPTVIA